MENQHRQIKGYKELEQPQIDAMNEIKELGVKIGELVDKLIDAPTDHRWVNIGKTNLQQGLMALTRSVAQPDFF